MKKALPVFVVLALLASGCKVDVSDSTPPANPSKVKAYGGMSSVRLSWTNPDDSDFYAVEITASALGETQSTIAIPGKPSEKKSFNFTGLTNGKEYTFVMCSVDTVTNRSSGTTITCYAQSNASSPSDTESSDSENNSEEDSGTQKSIIKTEKQTVTFSNTNANFTMIDISFTDGRTDDSIILGEDMIEVPYPTTVKPFRLAMYETSYNTWYEVLKWAEKHGYNIVNKGVEGLYGKDAEQQSNMSDPGSKPKLVEMPVCGLTWRDVMVWCNALSEMCGLTPVYCTDSNFKTPIRNSKGTEFGDLKNYALTPGEVDNPYVNKGANGFRLPYVEEWEYAARKKKDGGFISGRNVSGDEAGSAVDMTPTETMNGINFPKSTRQNEYCWQYGNSDWNGPSTTATGKDDTNTTLSGLTGKSISGKRMHLSGGRLPNHLGFYDMSGNVPEWCFDYNTPYGSTYKFHTQRSYRGGDHANDIVGSRCSGHKGGNLVALTGGFRIAQNH